MIALRSRTWAAPPRNVGEGRVIFRRRHGAVAPWQINFWTILGRLDARSGTDSRGVFGSMAPGSTLSWASVEFPLWVPVALLIMPAMWCGTRVIRQMVAASRALLRRCPGCQGRWPVAEPRCPHCGIDWPSAATMAGAGRPVRWGSRASICGLAVLVVGLAAGGSGLSALMLAIWVPGAVIVLILLSDLPRPRSS